MLLIAGIIASVIAIAAVVVVLNRKWKREDNISYVYGAVQPKGGSGDGNVSYIGQFPNRDECESACESQTGCRGYSWIDGAGGGYANACYGMKNIGKRVNAVGVYSGELLSDPAAEPMHSAYDGATSYPIMDDIPVGANSYSAIVARNAAAYSNTMLRDFGMGSAGE